MNSFKRFFFAVWRPGLVTLSLALIAYLLYFHNLRHLLPGYDSRELKAYATASNWHTIIGNPLNAPYKAIVWLAVALGHHSIITTRLVAASFGIGAALLFYGIVQRWHGFRIAFLATVLFATSAGFLHIARLGSAQILQMGVLVYLGLLIGYRHIRNHRLGLHYLALVTMAVLLYVPGFIWLELLGLIVLHKQVRSWLRSTPLIHVVIGAIVLLVLLAPLGHAAFKHSLVLNNLLGLPVNLASLKMVPLNILRTVLGIGIRSNANPEFYVGHAPILDVIELVLGLFGAYYYLLVSRNRRSVLLFATTILGIVLASLGGVVTIAMTIPLLYLFVAAGMDGLLKQWLTVFPRNPIAKYLGIALVCGLVFFSVLYQTRSYFIAWPHTIKTEQTFSRPQP